MSTTDPSRIEELLYYLHLMAGRKFSGSVIIWMYGGRVSRKTLSNVHRTCRHAGVPVDAADPVAQEALHA